MPAGALRERVSIQVRDAAATPNAFNEKADTWVNALSNLPAQVQALSGREFLHGQQVQADATHVVRIRTPATLALSTQQRFSWNSRLPNGTLQIRYLDIRHHAPLLKPPWRGHTEFLCTEHARNRPSP